MHLRKTRLCGGCCIRLQHYRCWQRLRDCDNHRLRIVMLPHFLSMLARKRQLQQEVAQVVRSMPTVAVRAQTRLGGHQAFQPAFAVLALRAPFRPE